MILLHTLNYTTLCIKKLETLDNLSKHHHKLMKTTITGIPMKEEQGEADSSNYDVPILHPQLGNSTEKLTL